MTVCDSVASTGVLRFVGPIPFECGAFHGIMVLFCARILFSGIFRIVRNLFELDLPL